MATFNFRIYISGNPSGNVNRGDFTYDGTNFVDVTVDDEDGYLNGINTAGAHVDSDSTHVIGVDHIQTITSGGGGYQGFEINFSEAVLVYDDVTGDLLGAGWRIGTHNPDLTGTAGPTVVDNNFAFNFTPPVGTQLDIVRISATTDPADVSAAGLDPANLTNLSANANTLFTPEHDSLSDGNPANDTPNAEVPEQTWTLNI